MNHDSYTTRQDYSEFDVFGRIQIKFISSTRFAIAPVYAFQSLFDASLR